jgi:hypothetical protein
MSVATVTSPAGSSLAALLSASAAPDSPSSPALPGASSAATGDDRGLATNVQLSDNVKAILAQAETYQSVAEKLQAFIQAKHAGSGESPQPAAGSKTDVDTAFEELSGGTAASDSQTLEPVQVVRSFDTGLKADGYTISAMASDRDGSSQIQIIGPNGFSFLDEHFGRSDEFVGGSSAGPGYSESEYQVGNVEYVTIAGAASVSTSTTASSASGSASTSSSAAQASTTTIAIDFNSGQISVAQAAAAQAATAAQISQPTPSFSTVA